MPGLLELPTKIWLLIWKEVYSDVIIYITLDKQTCHLNIDQVCTKCYKSSTLDPPACKQLRRPSNLVSPLLVSQEISRLVRPILYETVEFWFRHARALVCFHKTLIQQNETSLSYIRRVRLYTEILHTQCRQQTCLDVASLLEAKRSSRGLTASEALKKLSWDLAAVIGSLDSLNQLHVLIHHEDTQLGSEVCKVSDAVLAAEKQIRLRITLPVWQRGEDSMQEVDLKDYQLKYQAVDFD
ncbi:hypothetical protein B9Z65_6097 [Elsinoe australis]|uniref:Uncharacterized protein n=1 Tax=Elsinoe australis TaxID=40998 RepID=A0A2P8A7P9_9PEZI|nr:hypothetical protein B9Z65_6097 [Elsinoe australis]